MLDVRELYPGLDEDESFYAPADYSPLLESFGYEILLRVDDDDYRGDSRLLYRDGAKIGLLVFGWGSCSGCDALQGCESYEEITDLQVSLFERIRWFESASQALTYFREHDWEGDYSYRDIFNGEAVSLLRTLLYDEV